MKTCLHIIFLVIPLFSFLSAQEKESAFETISLGAGYSHNIYSGKFDDFWEPGFSAKFYITTDYYFGNLELGIQYGVFDKDEFSFRTFSSIYYYLGWTYDFQLTEFLTLNSGLQVGIDEYRFERLFPSDNENLLTEREFGAALEVKFISEIYSETEIFFGVSARRIFTARRIDLLYINVGLAHGFETPAWLKDFLR